MRLMKGLCTGTPASLKNAMVFRTPALLPQKTSALPCILGLPIGASPLNDSLGCSYPPLPPPSGCDSGPSKFGVWLSQGVKRIAVNRPPALACRYLPTDTHTPQSQQAERLTALPTKESRHPRWQMKRNSDLLECSRTGLVARGSSKSAVTGVKDPGPKRAK